MTYVYLLQSEDGAHFYTGATDNRRNRFKKHNAGDVSHTSKHRPWRLRAYVAFADPEQAWAFEKYLKTGSGRAFARKHF